MARLIFTLEDGTEIETELDANVISIGRHPGNSAVLPSPSVSAHHATIKRRHDSYYVQDHATTNGTKLNGIDVSEAKLEDGDRLHFGDVPALFLLRDDADAKSAKTELKKEAKVVPGKPVAQPPAAKPVQGQSSGCAGFILLSGFLILAFVIGLCLRHYQEHGGFFITDAVEKIQEKFSRK